MHFISEELEQYLENHSENEPMLLQQLNLETQRKVLNPRMLSGHYQGRFLSMISKLVNPKYILEIGTYTGYSALCLAEGLQKDGVLHTLDVNEELYDLQRHYFDQSEYGNQIQQHLGDALEIIPKIEMMFDLIFIDADKENYSNYFHLIVDKLNSGGILISDNVLWKGKILESVKESDYATKALLDYNNLLKDDPRLESLILPIRDGLTISRKK